MKTKANSRGPFWRTALIGALTGLLAAGVCASGFMYAQDSYVEDALYQHAVPSDGNVVLINIDQKSLDEMGPFSS